MHFTSFFLAILAMIFLVNVEAKVTFQKGFNPIRPGSVRTGDDDQHAFFVVSKRNSVRFYSKTNENGQYSNAICGHIIKGTRGLGKNGAPYYAGPCEVNAKTQSQILVGQCVDPNNPKTKKSGKATITWYPSTSPDNQRKAGVHVETEGDVWVGTTKDVAGSALVKGPFSYSGLPKEAILINCENTQRTPIPKN